MAINANNKLNIASVDFAEIKNNLKAFLKNQDQFTDYDFDGSAMSVLLDILAYNTFYNSYYLNMVANESFLDTALVRDNIVSIAKHLNYVPRSMRGARAFVNITVMPTGNTIPTVLTLNEYTPFQSEAIANKNYTFIAANSYSVPYSSGVFQFNNVELVQAEPITYNFAVTGDNSRRVFNLPSANVDLGTITVVVNEAAGANPGPQVYTLSTDITNIDSNSRIYFLEASTEGTYNLYFGDGIFGRYLANGETVSVTYGVTAGAYANYANNFTIMSPIGGYGNITINSVSAAAAGAGRETNDSIKALAPVAYTGQNRVVTKKDYQNFLLQNYPNIDSITVWGGEENTPPMFGKVFISIKPQTGIYLTQIEKDRIASEILGDYKMVTATPMVVDPDYTYIVLTITANYDPKKTTLTEAQLQAVIRSAVLGYNTRELGKFDSHYRTSKLAQYIVNAEASILGVGVKTFLKKTIIPSLNTGIAGNYTVDFKTQLKRGTYADKLYSTPSYSTLDSHGIIRNCLIEEIPMSFNSINDILISSPGSGFTSTPQVVIEGDGTGATAVANIVNGQLNSITITNPGQGYTLASVSIVGGGGYGALVIPVLQAKTGYLRSYYIDNANKYYVNQNQGTIDYNSGTVTIKNFNPLDINNTTKDISIFVQPEFDYVSPKRNSILTLDGSDPTSIVINMIADNT